MYYGTTIKLAPSFIYKGKVYHKGTKVLFNGKCFLDDKEVSLTNVVVEFVDDEYYHPYRYWCFTYNNQLYKYRYFEYSGPYTERRQAQEFEKYIMQIVVDEPTTATKKGTTKTYSSRKAGKVDNGALAAGLLIIVVLALCPPLGVLIVLGIVFFKD